MRRSALNKLLSHRHLPHRRLISIVAHARTPRSEIAIVPPRPENEEAGSGIANCQPIGRSDPTRRGDMIPLTPLYNRLLGAVRAALRYLWPPPCISYSFFLLISRQGQGRRISICRHVLGMLPCCFFCVGFRSRWRLRDGSPRSFAVMSLPKKIGNMHPSLCCKIV